MIKSREIDDIIKGMRGFLPFAVINSDPRNRIEKLLSYSANDVIPNSLSLMNVDGTARFTKLGIGVDPISALTIDFDPSLENGLMLRDNRDTNRRSLINQSGGATYFYNTNTGVIGTEAIRILSNNNTYFSANVGVGTDTPSTSMTGGIHIKSTAGNSLILEKSSGAAMQFRSDATTIRASIAGINGGDGLVFQTGAAQTERMRITSDGSVGIGDFSGSAPTEALDINGSINLSAGNTLKIDGVAAVFSNWTVNGSDIYRNSNVGIGVSSPQSLLHLNETNGNTALAISDDASAGDYITFQIIGGQYNGGNNEIQSINTTDMTLNVYQARSLIFKTDNTERMRIDSDGLTTITKDNSGVVYNNSLNHSLTLINNNGTAGNFSTLSFNNGSANTAFISAKHNRDGNNDADLLFSTRNSLGSASIDMRINSNATDSLVFIGRDNEVDGQVGNGVISAPRPTGTNIAGANLSISAGRSTGSGAGGYLWFGTSPAGSSGTTPNVEVERMRITSAGKVGIGYTNPTTAKLEINGGADDSEIIRGRTDGGNGNNARFTIKAYSDGGGAGYGGGIKIQTRDTVNIFHDALTIDSSQRIGIGTDSPDEPLTVIGGSSTSSTANFTGGAANTNATLASDYNLVFQIDANNTVGGRSYNWRVGGKGFSDGTSLMTLTNEGQLGIGTSDPSYQLDLDGGTTVNDRLRLNRGSDDTANFMTLGWNNISVHRNNVPLSSSQVSMSFKQVGSDGSRTALHIAALGNVAVGNTNAFSNLHITDSSFQNGTLRVGGSQTSLGLEISYDQAGATVGTIYNNPTYTNTAQLLKIGADGDANPNQLVLKGDGNVGIGISSPAYALDVDSGSSFNVARFAGNGGIDTFIYTDSAYWSFGDAASYGGNLWGGHKTNNELYARTNGATRLRIDSSGNVGIGVGSSDTIGEELVVNGSMLVYGAGGGAGSGNGALWLGSSSNGRQWGIRTDSTDRDLFFDRFVSGVGWTESVRIDYGTGLLQAKSSLNVIGTTYSSDRIQSAAGFGGHNNGRRIMLPGGGEYNTTASVVTGAIKVRLPISWSNYMQRIVIKVYEYTTGESFEVVCGGYDYAAAQRWYNEFAYIIGQPNVDRNFTVRFGHDGTGIAVYIGELNSTWAYPQVFVTEYQAGYNGYPSTALYSGWNVSFITSWPTYSSGSTSNGVSNTLSNCSIYKHLQAIADGGTGATTAADARTNLGLGSLATASTINNGNWSGADLSIANGGTGASDAGTARTNLGLGTLATASTISNSNWSGTDLAIANGGTGASDAGTARTNLGLGSLATASTINNGNWSGTDLAIANGGTGASDAGTARSNLGLGSLATASTINNGNWSGTDLAIANGGTGASDAGTARTNLGLGTAATYASTNYVRKSDLGNASYYSADNWIEFTSTHGLYWSSLGHHFWPESGSGFQARSGSSSSTGIKLLQSGNNLYGWLYADSSTQGFLTTGGSWVTRISNDGGNELWHKGSMIVGDATVALVPSYTLDVQGSIRATGDVVSDSDVRHKTNIHTIDNALEKVNNMRGVYFTKNEEDHVGVIAQEIEEILPEVVRTASDEEGTKSVSYGNIVGVLIEAIKEQQQQINELKEMLEK